jgi:hypothetical protein
MNTFEITKTVLGFVVGAGVSAIVSQVVDQNTTASNLPHKLIIFAGKTGISLVLNDVVEEHLNKKIDNIETWWTENVTDKETTDSGSGTP